MSQTDLNQDGKVSGWEVFPYWFDRLRIFPRVFISIYIYMFYNTVAWFMALPEPNNAQAGLVSIVVGAGAAWFGLYVNSGSKNSGQIIVQTDTSSGMGTRGSYSGAASSEASFEEEAKNPYR